MKARWILIYTYIFRSLNIWKQTNAASRLSFSAIEQYVNICGKDRTCLNNTNTPGGFLPLRTCPWCSCDDECAAEGICCPDKHISGCANVTVISDSSGQADTSYRMTDWCSDTTNDTLNDLCLGKGNSSLDLRPVSANIHYKNKYCALCNGVTTYKPWELVVQKCKYPGFDINLYSSFKSIFDDIERFGCELSYDPPFESNARTCELTSYSIGECNVTGLWQVYDDTIDWACTHYYEPYLVFRNVFCYICNTGDSRKIPIVSKCLNNERDYLRECFEEPISKRTFPYKNVYCKECSKQPGLRFKLNKRVNMYKSTYNFPYQGSLSVEECDLCYLRKSSLYSILQSSPTVEDMCSLPLFTVPVPDKQLAKPSHDLILSKIRSSHVNMSALYAQYIAYGGTSQWCDTKYRISDNDTRECSCDMRCFINKNCCPDMLVNPSVSCSSIGDQYSTVVDKCPKEFNDIIIIYLCEINSNISLLDEIPVFNKMKRKEFKNVFCLLCNLMDSVDVRLDVLSSVFRDLELTCRTFVDIADYLPLSNDLLQELRHVCQISALSYTDSSITVDVCDKVSFSNYSVEGSTCPQYDTDPVMSDIKYMCEETDLYVFSNCKLRTVNIFCEMCNAVITNSTHGSLSETLLSQAQDFQNLKCEQNKSNIPPVHIAKCETCFGYRVLFSIYDAIDSKDQTSRTKNSDTNCTDDDFQDPITGLCRKIGCSLGKVYRGGRCIPFLTFTKDLSYTVSLQMQLQSLTSYRKHSIFQLLKNVSHQAGIVDFPNMVIMEDYFIANKPCMEQIENQSNGAITVDMYLRYEIHETVSRDSSEEYLFQLVSENYQFHDFVQNKSFLSFDIPSRIGSMSQEYCKISNQTNGRWSKHVFRVDKFLTCPQITLLDSEFTLQYDRTVLKIPHLKRTYTISDFSIETDGQVKVCINDFFVKEDSNAFKTTVEIFYAICIIISMVCLLLTFLVYSVFPRLQTLPGKNLMTLVFVMFFVQLSVVFGLLKMPSWTCVLIGFGAHYIWLALFCCNANCSFHMWRVLKCSEMRSHSRDRIHFRRCLIGILLIPLLIVSLYILCAVFLLDVVPYGGSRCFIQKIPFLIVFFLLPNVIICLLNITLFTLTLRQIKGVPQTNGNIEKRQLTLVFLKLFTITGITWLFQLIDGFFPPSLFSLLVATLNGLQGTFIFITYVCNKTVLEIILDKCRKFMSQSPRGQRSTQNLISAISSMECTHVSKDGDVCPLTDTGSAHRKREILGEDSPVTMCSLADTGSTHSIQIRERKILGSPTQRTPL